MNKNKIRRSKLYAFIVLIIYCVSIVPSFIIHDHSDDTAHHHNFSDCEIFTENIDQHINCSHEQHVDKLLEDCFLCSHYIVHDHLSLFFMIESKDRPFIVKGDEVCNKVSSRELINLLNKSPPLLI